MQCLCYTSKMSEGCRDVPADVVRFKYEILDGKYPYPKQTAALNLKL